MRPPSLFKIAQAMLVLLVLWLAFNRASAPLLADDVWSLRAAMLPFDQMLSTLAADVHPPAYFILLAAWVRIFGDGEIALRGLSILFYLLSVLAMYRLAGRFHGRDGALLCAAVYSFTPLVVLGANLVRMYSLLSLLGILSTTAWVDIALMRRGRRSDVRVWIAINILGTFCHLWFFCLLLGQSMASLVIARRDLRKLIPGFALSIAPYALLWFPSLVRQLRESSEAAAWLQPPDAGLLSEMLIMQFGLMALALPVVAFRAWEEHDWRDLVPSWVLLLLAFVLLPPLLISFWKPFFHIRFTIVASHLFALTFGSIAIRYFDSRLTVVLIPLAFAFSLGLRAGQNQCDSRSAARFLAERVRDGDTVIFASLSRQPVDHYLDKVAPGRVWHEASFPAEIDSHPGYEGSITVRSERRGELNAEAAALGLALLKRPGALVFFLHGVRPDADRPLLDTLRARLQPAPDASLACPGGAYFNQVAAFKVPQRKR